MTTIKDVHLKDSLISDKAVEFMVQFKELKSLFLRKHDTITKACIPFINQMQQLESLNITRTKITLSDLCDLLDNQSLKEVFLDAEEDEKNILEKAFLLKERMPNCDIFLNCSSSIDAFGIKEKPIYS